MKLLQHRSTRMMVRTMLNCTEVIWYLEQFKNNGLVQNVVVSFVGLGILTSVLVICTNVAVIYTIAKTRTLQTLSNLLILALAVSDFLVGVLIEPPYIASNILGYNKAFQSLCLPVQLYGFFGWAFFPITSLHLSVLTLDRFLTLQFHLRYKDMVSWKHYCVVFVFIWLYGFVTGTVFITRRDLILHVLSVFFICSFLTLVCMLSIGFTVRRHTAQIASHQQISSRCCLNMPRFRKSVNTIYFVMAAFLFCHVPYVGFVLCLGPLKDMNTTFLRISAIVSHYILLLNSFINPVIYFWRIRELRKSALKLMLRRE